MSWIAIGRSGASGRMAPLHARHFSQYSEPAFPLPAGEPASAAKRDLVQTTTSHPTRSPGLGAWTPRGDGGLDFIYRAFNFDATGAFTGRVRTRARVTFNATRDGFSAQATSENFDLSEAIVASFDVTLDGTRIRVEPLG